MLPTISSALLFWDSDQDPSIVYLIPNIWCEREEDVCPPIHLILLDNFVDNFPGRLSEEDEQNNQNCNHYEVRHQVLWNSSVCVLKKKDL